MLIRDWIYVVCFFEQKTRYELRISDWSTDVCSSDLKVQHPRTNRRRAPCAAHMASPMYPFRNYKAEGSKISPAPPWQDAGRRSEEHTSELRSLMRNWYSFFCFKKKRTNNTPRTIVHALTHCVLDYYDIFRHST